MSQGIADLKEGTIIEVDSNMSLTEFEKQAQAGKIDINKYKRFTNLPSGLVDSANNVIDIATAERIKEIANTKQTIAPSVNISQLSPEKRAEVFETLRTMAGSYETGSSDEEVLDVLDTGIVTMPGFDLGDEQPVIVPAGSEVVTTNNTTSDINKDLSVKEEIVCPNCLWNHSHDPTEVTESDKLSYLRAVLGSKPFTKSYKLFGNKITVTFRTRPLEVQNLINEQLISENKDGRIPSHPVNLSLITHNMRMRRLNLASAVQSMTGIPTLPELNTKEAVEQYRSRIEPEKNNVVAAADRVIFGKWSEALYSAIFKQFSVFEDLCFRLTEAAASPDFWVETAEQI